MPKQLNAVLPWRFPLHTEWTRASRVYLTAAIALHFAWEVIQLPLYSLWRTGSFGNLAYAIAHCTVGDGMIAGLTLLGALATVAQPSWPNRSGKSVWLTVVIASMFYTVFSEWMNVHVRGSWAYSELMPTLPWLSTGLAPLLQWLVVPTVALWITSGIAPWRSLR